MEGDNGAATAIPVLPAAPIPIPPSNAGGSSSLLLQYAKEKYGLPLNAAGTELELPDTVTTIVVDVGALDSDYLAAMERTHDTTTALFLWEPQPLAAAELQKRVAANPEMAQRVFVIAAAMGDIEQASVTFHIASAPSCGSLLPEGPSNFWCTKTIGTIQVPLHTLGDFLQLLPLTWPPQRRFVHLSIATQGSGMLVVQGARDQLSKVETLVMECQNVESPTDPRLHRIGAATCPALKAFLCQPDQGRNFCDYTYRQQGPEDMQSKAFFAKPPNFGVDGLKDLFPSTPTLMNAYMNKWYHEKADNKPLSPPELV